MAKPEPRGGIKVRHRPRARFSQNFLINPAIVAAIMHALRPAPDQRMVEIGPGLGALTRPLLGYVPELHAIEIDRDLAAKLKCELGQRLNLHTGDVLDFDFSALGSDLRIIGNLPYNISTPVLFQLARYVDHIRDIHVMLQKEVVARIVAAPATSSYGRLSVMLQYRFDMSKVLDVPAAAFDPQPEVESAVLRLVPLRPPPHVAVDEQLFAAIVAAAFSQRRKTLRNSLSGYLTGGDFAALGIPISGRAQELGVEQYVAISNYLGARPRTATQLSSE